MFHFSKESVAIGYCSR